MRGVGGVTEDGRFALRFERRFEHPREKVWRALTERDELRVWFVQILDYDRSRLEFTEGAELAFVPKSGDTGTGTVVRADRPRLLEYTWDGETLRFELAAEGEHACVLVFTNVLDDRETGSAVAPGWEAGLDLLAESLGRR
ncbi:SRPBCC domain-containing protein [Saccharothrix sp. AJ9571]|nr:SRPBCC domain-containing protein [Saccharothrix sp. AJ9571]